MSRYIDIEPYEKDGWYLQKTYYNDYSAGIKTIPLVSVLTVEVEPVKHGRWVQSDFYSVKCSNCGNKSSRGFNYCPNCGADMQGRENDK